LFVSVPAAAAKAVTGTRQQQQQSVPQLQQQQQQQQQQQVDAKQPKQRQQQQQTEPAPAGSLMHKNLLFSSALKSTEVSLLLLSAGTPDGACGGCSSTPSHGLEAAVLGALNKCTEAGGLGKVLYDLCQLNSEEGGAHLGHIL
jgi:hypothetical protein